MGQLQVEIATTQDQLLPKKKFTFKSRPKKERAENPKSDPLPPVTASAPRVHRVEVTQNQTGFRNREKELLALSVSMHTFVYPLPLTYIEKFG